MKRIVVIFLAALLLTTVLAVPAMAAEGCLVRGPDAVRAGDTITVTFYAGNIYKGAYRGTGTVAYDTNVLTLKGYTKLLNDNWSVVFFGDSFTFDNFGKADPLVDNVPVFSAEFVVNPEVATGTAVSVSVSNVILSNGEYDNSQGSVTWIRYVAEPLSANANLAALRVEGFQLSPAFDPEQLHYAVYLPNEVESVRLTVQAADYRATVSVPTLENIPVGKFTYDVPVTAQNGDVKLYTITTYRAEPVQDPYQIPEETEPVTEPTTEPTEEPTTEPTTQPTEEPTTQPTVKPADTSSSKETSSGGMSKTTVGLLWILSIVAAFVGGIIAPIILGYRE